jgi:hypothetical protein
MVSVSPDVDREGPDQSSYEFNVDVIVGIAHL